MFQLSVYSHQSRSSFPCDKRHPFKYLNQEIYRNLFPPYRCKNQLPHPSLLQGRWVTEETPRESVPGSLWPSCSLGRSPRTAVTPPIFFILLSMSIFWREVSGLFFSSRDSCPLCRVSLQRGMRRPKVDGGDPVLQVCLARPFKHRDRARVGRGRDLELFLHKVFSHVGAWAWIA